MNRWWQYPRHPGGGSTGRPMPAERYRALPRQQRRKLDRDCEVRPHFGLDPALELAAFAKWGNPPPSAVWSQRVQPPPPCWSCWGTGINVGLGFRAVCYECGGAKYPPMVDAA